MRPYSYYAYAALRCYFLGTYKDDEPTKANFKAARAALESLDTGNAVLILQEVYTSQEKLSVAIKQAAERFTLPESDVWTLVGVTESRFARERGLI
jgi:hypothetical protein